MNSSSLWRYSPLAGVVTVVLWLIGVLIIESAGDTPDEGSAQEVAAYFENDENSIYLGALALFLGALFLIWFAAALRYAVSAAEAPRDRLAPIVFGAGVATAVLAMANFAPQVSGAFASNESDAPLAPEAAQALWYVGDGFFVAAEYAAALLLVATAIAILLYRFLPVWLAWIGILLALVLLIPPIGWAGLIFGFPLWLLVVSVLLYLRWGAAPRADATAS